MTPLTTSDSTALLRTDFSDQSVWDDVAARVTAVGTGEEDGFQANVYVVDDVAYEGAGATDVLALTPRPGYRARLVVIVDSATIASPDHAVLVLAVHGDERGQSFRCLPGKVQSVENNLSLYNMDWHEFTNSVEAGVFRGF